MHDFFYYVFIFLGRKKGNRKNVLFIMFLLLNETSNRPIRICVRFMNVRLDPFSFQYFLLSVIRIYTEVPVQNRKENGTGLPSIM